MPNLIITIPKPCSENWEKMKPLEQGRFCESCEKQVLDFTKFGTIELIDYFKYPKGNICGRINKMQLNTFTSLQSQSSRFKYLSYKLFVASCLTLLTSTKGYTKEILSNELMYQDDVKSRKLIKPVNETDTLITISGVIKDGSDYLPISGASIAFKGGQGLTTTDVNGGFKIQIKVSPNQKMILVSKYLGYETIETEVLSTQTQDLQIKLTQSAGLMGEVVIAGGLFIKRPLLSRIGHFFKSIFRGDN